MKKTNLVVFYFVLLMSLLQSCGKEEFTSKRKGQETKKVEPKKQNTSPPNPEVGVTIIKPKVDLLFLLDNSTSTAFFKDNVKNAIQNVVSNISNDFDYHALMAPLVTRSYESINTNARFFSNDSLNPSGIFKTTVGNAGAQANFIMSSLVGGTAEAGLQRIVNLLKVNRSNGVFRQNSHLILVVISNDDDNSYITEIDTPTARNAYVNNKSQDLLCIRGNSGIGSCSSRLSSIGFGSPLNSAAMRLVSLVSLSDSNSCALKRNHVYQGVSSLIYSASSSTDQNGRSFPDSHEICNSSQNNIFSSIYSTINQIIVPHVFKYWPLANIGTQVDESTVVVKKGSSTLPRIANSISINRDNNGYDDRDSFGNPISGYKIIPGNVSVNLRFLPNAGQPFTGQVIELFGSAKVTFPESLSITSFPPPSEFFGFRRFTNGRPIIGTIIVRRNGSPLARSTENGWELFTPGGSFSSINWYEKIESATSYAPSLDASYAQGFYLKLYGDAILSHGDSLTIDYVPQSN